MRLVIGIPNAGKTTYAKDALRYDDLQLTTRKRYEHICDVVRAGEECIEGVFGESGRRAQIVHACHEGGHDAVCVWLDTPLETCIERERSYRKRGDGFVRVIAEHFEPPTYAEGWDEIIRIT